MHKYIPISSMNIHVQKKMQTAEERHDLYSIQGTQASMCA